MRLLFKPLAIVAGIIARLLGRSVFRTVWARIDDQPPPKALTGEGSMIKVVGATALQASVMAGVSAVVERLAARSFHHLTGLWPKKPPDDDQD